MPLTWSPDDPAAAQAGGWAGTTNPYLADVQDMVRLSPLGPLRESILQETRFSASMARTADPEWLIDTNGHPMPSLAAFREYMEIQPEFGVPNLCYATHLDTIGGIHSY